MPRENKKTRTRRVFKDGGFVALYDALRFGLVEPGMRVRIEDTYGEEGEELCGTVRCTADGDVERIDSAAAEPCSIVLRDVKKEMFGKRGYKIVENPPMFRTWSLGREFADLSKPGHERICLLTDADGKTIWERL